MLTSLNRLTGLPVVWQDRHVGYVERAVADLERMRLHGLVVRKGLGSARWLPEESILMAGRRAVAAAKLPVRMPDEQPLQARCAVFASGGSAGEVCDVIIQSETLKAAALEITQGPLYRLLGRCGYAPGWRICMNGDAEEAVVPPLLTWTQLCTQLGEGDDQ